MTSFMLQTWAKKERKENTERNGNNDANEITRCTASGCITKNMDAIFSWKSILFLPFAAFSTRKISSPLDTLGYRTSVENATTSTHNMASHNKIESSIFLYLNCAFRVDISSEKKLNFVVSILVYESCSIQRDGFSFKQHINTSKKTKIKYKIKTEWRGLDYREVLVLNDKNTC